MDFPLEKKSPQEEVIQTERDVAAWYKAVANAIKALPAHIFGQFIEFVDDATEVMELSSDDDDVQGRRSLEEEYGKEVEAHIVFLLGQ